MRSTTSRRATALKERAVTRHAHARGEETGARARRAAGALLVAGLLALALALGPGPAMGQTAHPQEEPARSSPRGTLVLDTVPAPSLEGNRLGDPGLREVTVYLPPSYGDRPETRLPALYLLHNYAGDGRQWTDRSFGGFRLHRALDSLIVAGRVKEMIVVMPDARTAVGSPYLSSSLTGDWERFLAVDLPAHVDRRYRTIAEPAGRGVAGHSAGGHAALDLAFRHPEVFGAVYAMSPCCLGFEGELEPLNAQAALLARLLDPGASCESGAWYFRFPLLYAHLCPERVGALRRIAFDVGAADPLESVLPGATALGAALRELGIAHRFERYRGDHASRVGARMADRVLPFFSEAFRANRR